jgi:hypothetical protein
MQDIFKYIEEHNEEAIGELEKLCSLPSVSARGQAIGETAEWVSVRLRALGFDVQVIEKPAASGDKSSSGAQPVVYAALTPGPSSTADRSPVRGRGEISDLFVACYANDYIGYVVPEHSYDEGGYEPGVTFFGPEAEGIIRGASVELLREVMNGE